MRLSADGGVTWTNVVDNGPSDANPAAGFITYAGPVGNWVAVISTGVGSPAVGTPITPSMDVNTLDFSLNPGTLIIQMSDTGFLPFPNETFVASLTTTTDGTITYTTYRDTGNVLFGTTANSGTASVLINEGPYTGGTFVASNAVVIANGGNALYSLTMETTISHPAGGQQTVSDAFLTALPPPPRQFGAGDTATIGFWHNKNGQALILSAPNSPALGNWLGSNFPCLFGSLQGKSDADVAAAFLTDFNVKGTKTYAQILGTAFAIYFTSSNLAGNGAAQYGFNVTPDGIGAELFNVGNLGTTIGLQNNQSYTILQILQAANSDCPFSPAVFNALNSIFDAINSSGDIN
jgi:hypothetical protein